MQYREICEKKFKNPNFLPFLITIIFFITVSYISFFHHLYFFERDGIFYYFVGKEILSGNTENIAIPGSSIGGPILHAYFGSLIDEPFLAGKLISIFGGTGIILLSFYITKNFFERKIAILTQILFAINAKIIFLSVLVLNEISPLFFIFLSLYFATKKNRTIPILICVGIFLGISFWFRFQSGIVLISFLIFLLIFEKEKILKLKNTSITLISFVLTALPVLIFNYFNFGTFLTNKTNMYLFYHSKFQNEIWHEQMRSIFDQGLLSGISIDPILFFKNYLYNLFFHNPNALFKFSIDLFDSLSIIPLLPFLGMIPVFGGFLYLLKVRFSKRLVLIILFLEIISFMIILFFGNFEYHFFLPIIIPFIVLGIYNIKKIPENFIFLLLFSLVFFLVVSIIPVYRSYQLLPMWIIIPTLSSVFLIKGIPIIQIKISELFLSRKIKK
ncbi:glycosyltransferase family 39 protein [Nitrosopumilus sp. b2]|uniref:ArnT family glycosyltransferase n=1 Tax=Nitrosopumilus sp. b2 TaxID=2109908 RepID=UPI0015F59554|nr:glycosyltransferase family 39 protein [Nitrosopumilus sp. b2]